jgi:hypothetical protein
MASVFVLAILAVALAGAGCDHKLVDYIISGVVVDAGTGAPIDSARVYVAYFDPPFSFGERHLESLTDENGKFRILFGFEAVVIVDVEKEGYVPARQILKGGGYPYFALEHVAPVSNAKVGLQ